jgi:hypothetical protein
VADQSFAGTGLPTDGNQTSRALFLVGLDTATSWKRSISWIDPDFPPEEA